MTRIEGIKKRIQDEENEATFKPHEDTFWLVKMVEEMMPLLAEGACQSIIPCHEKLNWEWLCRTCRASAVLAELEEGK